MSLVNPLAFMQYIEGDQLNCYTTQWCSRSSHALRVAQSIVSLKGSPRYLALSYYCYQFPTAHSRPFTTAGPVGFAFLHVSQQLQGAAEVDPWVEGFPHGKAFCLRGCSPWKQPHLRRLRGPGGAEGTRAA